jgi:hypothetical protein
MGTSSARRGPTTAFWRAAKGAATRYLSPAGEGAVTAGEVVARYLAALEEAPGQGDRLAAFRFTRKVAQDLGAFWHEVNSRGWEAALANRGLAPEMPAPGLSAVLAGSGGGLEEAVVRTSLALVLRPPLSQAQSSAPGRSSDIREPALLVRRFLATALHLRLALDLGEPLEGAARSYGRLRDGLSRIRDWIEAQAPGPGGLPVVPVNAAHWQGLAGWTWVTEFMSGLLAKLT